MPGPARGPVRTTQSNRAKQAALDNAEADLSEPDRSGWASTDLRNDHTTSRNQAHDVTPPSAGDSPCRRSWSTAAIRRFNHQRHGPRLECRSTRKRTLGEPYGLAVAPNPPGNTPWAKSRNCGGPHPRLTLFRRNWAHSGGSPLLPASLEAAALHTGPIEPMPARGWLASAREEGLGQRGELARCFDRNLVAAVDQREACRGERRDDGGTQGVRPWRRCCGPVRRSRWWASRA